MKLSKELEDAVELLRNAELDARNGMTEELFWMISALVPIPNVDLLVTNEKGQLLLSRRNDDFFECVRRSAKSARPAKLSSGSA